MSAVAAAAAEPDPLYPSGVFAAIRTLVEDGVPVAQVPDRILAVADPEAVRWMARSWIADEAEHIARCLAREVERQEAARLREAAKTDEEREAERQQAEWAEAERQRSIERRRARKAAAVAAGFRTVKEWDAHQQWERDEQRAARLGYASVDEFRSADDHFSRELKVALDDYLDDIGATAALEFTKAFLDTEFALGDGRRVTWGEATVGDHRARITMMTKMIEGCAEDVALHLKVLETLVATGARNLNELAR